MQIRHKFDSNKAHLFQIQNVKLKVPFGKLSTSPSALLRINPSTNSGQAK
jgi:hypothetical protein